MRGTSSFDILIADKKRMARRRSGMRCALPLVRRATLWPPCSATRARPACSKRTAQPSRGRWIGGDLATVQDILKGGAVGKEAAAGATLQNDIAKFGQHGIPIALKFFDTINPKLQQFSAWVDQHPDDAKRLFEGLLKMGEGILKVIAGLANSVTVIRGVASGLGAIAVLRENLHPPSVRVRESPERSAFCTLLCCSALGHRRDWNIAEGPLMFVHASTLVLPDVPEPQRAREDAKKLECSIELSRRNAKLYDAAPRSIAPNACKLPAGDGARMAYLG
jgi:hypothetical protein